MELGLTGKRALVTAASRGLGRADVHRREPQAEPLGYSGGSALPRFTQHRFFWDHAVVQLHTGADGASHAQGVPFVQLGQAGRVMGDQRQLH